MNALFRVIARLAAVGGDGARPRRSRPCGRAVGLVVSATVLAAGTAVAAASDDPQCPGVRPGAVMYPESGQKYRTSYNFMLAGSDGGTYTLIDGFALDTQSQVAVSNVTDVHVERTWPPGKGPGVTDGSHRVVGHAVWYAQDGSNLFALIRLDVGQPWSSVVCGHNRPTGIDTTIDDLPTLVSIYGQGADRADRQQTDVLPQGRFAPDRLNKMIPVTSGDISAPVLSGDNQALGFLGHQSMLAPRDYVHPAGTGGVVWRLPPLMKRSGARLHIDLELERPRSGKAK